jgi:hypothetical protein
MDEGSCRWNEVLKTCGTEIKTSFAERTYVQWAIIFKVFYFAKIRG